MKQKSQTLQFGNYLQKQLLPTLALGLLLLNTTELHAQKKAPIQQPKKTTQTKIGSKEDSISATNIPLPDRANTADMVYTFVEESPEFPGGNAAMYQFLSRELKYPQNDSLSGTVIMNFVVDKSGEIRDIKCLKGIKNAPAFEEESLRVIKTMPKWKPGKNKGEFVNVQYNLPIRFVLR